MAPLKAWHPSCCCTQPSQEGSGVPPISTQVEIQSEIGHPYKSHSFEKSRFHFGTSVVSYYTVLENHRNSNSLINNVFI